MAPLARSKLRSSIMDRYRRARPLPSQPLSSWNSGQGGGGNHGGPHSEPSVVRDLDSKINPGANNVTSERGWTQSVGSSSFLVTADSSSASSSSSSSSLPAKVRDSYFGTAFPPITNSDFMSHARRKREENARCSEERSNSIPQEALMASIDIPQSMPANASFLKVAIVGSPNAGKSSLLNCLLDNFVAGVSKKANTTTQEIRGILTRDNVQLCFIDVPGIIPHSQRVQMKELARKAWDGYHDADLILYIADCVKRPTSETFGVVRKICPLPTLREEEAEERQQRYLQRNAERNSRDSKGGDGAAQENPAHSMISTSDQRITRTLRTSGKPVILVLNKIDKQPDWRWVVARRHEYTDRGVFRKVFYTSATEKKGVHTLLNYLFQFADEHECYKKPWIYGESTSTSLSKVDQFHQLLRATLLTWFNKDVPYRIEHKTVGWTTKRAPESDLDDDALDKHSPFDEEDTLEKKDDKHADVSAKSEKPKVDLVIEHELIVADSVVARMICGVRNRILARLRENVEYKLSQMWKNEYANVEVCLFVKPKKLRLSKKDIVRKSSYSFERGIKR